MKTSVILVCLAVLASFPAVLARGPAAAKATGASEVQSAGLCDICTLVVSYVDTFLKENPNATATEIEQSLESVCALLGGDTAQECDAFVQAEVPAIRD